MHAEEHQVYFPLEEGETCWSETVSASDRSSDGSFLNAGRKQYVRSLKDRLGRLESLLKTAGIWDEKAMSEEELSDDDDDEPADEDSEAEATQPEESPKSTGATTVIGKPSPGTGVLGHALKFDGRDDSRYFGKILSLAAYITIDSSPKQDARLPSRSYHHKGSIG